MVGVKVVSLNNLFRPFALSLYSDDIIVIVNRVHSALAHNVIPPIQKQCNILSQSYLVIINISHLFCKIEFIC